MSNPPNFLDAHSRHLEDAELLFGHDRWANADQLFGLSAECGLKAVMQGLGMPQAPPAGYRKHVNDLWQLFQDFVSEREGAHYLAMLPSSRPFADWTIEDRYAHRDALRKADVAPHRAATWQIAQMVSDAEKDQS